MKRVAIMAIVLLCSCGRSAVDVCEPGRQVECACTSGDTGFQICLADRSGWGSCDCRCIKDCTGRDCGPDPECGESCGACRENELCNDTGRCECAHQNCSDACCAEGQFCHSGSCCTPDCTGRECGLDPVCESKCGECFNSCTQAGDPTLCIDGLCLNPCCPTTCELLGVRCGFWDDGCGGVLGCGTCGPNSLCNRKGECECFYEACEGICCDRWEVCYLGECCQPQCTDKECGSDRCGGVCWQCGGCEVCNPDEQCVSGSQSDGQKTLYIIGRPVVSMRYGDRAQLWVQLSDVGIGETIHFEMVGYAFGSALLADTATTDENGLATVTMTAGQPGQEAGYFHVLAYHADIPKGVYFLINLKPTFPGHDLIVLGSQARECYINDTVELRVKLIDKNRNTPVRGDSVSFYIVNPASGGDASIENEIVDTDLSGQASAVFESGRLELQYQVIALPHSVSGKTAAFQITTRARSGCLADSDCIGDDACTRGECGPPGILPELCNVSEHCPPGYLCENHQCLSCPEDSPDPHCPADGKTCVTDSDCTPGLLCRNGYCYPDNQPGVVIPEFGGTWITQYHFDVSESIDGMSTAGIINSLNSVASYCEITGFGFIDDLLCNLTPAYTADWIDILNDIFSNLPLMLSELWVKGKTTPYHINPRELLSFHEDWKSIQVVYPNACCFIDGNFVENCNPYDQPDFPDCAVIEIAREDLEAKQDILDVETFTGKVSVDNNGGTNTYTLSVDPRTVKIKFSLFISFLVDRLVQVFIGYNDLDEALENVKDCDSIQVVVDCCLGGWAPDIHQTCEDMKPSGYSLMRGLLDQIGPGWKYLKFNGWASIATQGDPPEGTHLGLADFEQSGDGHLEGESTLFVQGNVEGAWFGERK
ncbi:MAG TPA: hypothetical protein VM425_00770 [Myxococcota bacterium]|nr:hypothetical protein [Myxococcota bacterium]